MSHTLRLHVVLAVAGLVFSSADANGAGPVRRARSGRALYLDLAPARAGGLDASASPGQPHAGPRTAAGWAGQELPGLDDATSGRETDAVDDTQIVARFAADADVAGDPLLRPSLVSAGAVCIPGDEALRAVGDNTCAALADVGRLGSPLGRGAGGTTFPLLMALGLVGLGVFGLVRTKPARPYPASDSSGSIGSSGTRFIRR